MTGPVDLDLVKATLAQRIDSLVQQLYPAAELDGRHWRLGDVAGSPGQSLAITRLGAHAGLWKDFSSGEAGSALDLIAAALFDGNVDAEVVRWAVQWCGLGALTADEQRRAGEKARAATQKAEAEARTAAAKKTRMAQAIWIGGGAIERTPADRYLAARAIDLASMGHHPRALRYVAECYNAEVKAGLPAMVAFVLDPEAGKQCAVHRTWLARDAADSSRWIKHPRLKEQKKTLGPYKGGHIPLWRGNFNGPMREMPAGSWVATAEGIENALSIAVQKPDLRCIAHLSLSNLGALKLPDNIGGLYVAADNDAPGSPADLGFQHQLAILESRGIPHRVVRAPDGIKDINDWLKACAPALAQRGVA